MTLIGMTGKATHFAGDKKTMLRKFSTLIHVLFVFCLLIGFQSQSRASTGRVFLSGTFTAANGQITTVYISGVVNGQTGAGSGLFFVTNWNGTIKGSIDVVHVTTYPGTNTPSGGIAHANVPTVDGSFCEANITVSYATTSTLTYQIWVHTHTSLGDTWEKLVPPANFCPIGYLLAPQ